MSAPGMIAFQAVNLSTDFDFDQYYSDSLMAQVAEELHNLAKTGVNIYAWESNPIIAEKVAKIFDPNNSLTPDPTFILLQVIRELGPDFVGYNYFMGDDLLQPMKDFVGDTLDFVKDSTFGPIWDKFKWPLIVGGSLYALYIFGPAIKAMTKTLTSNKGSK